MFTQVRDTALELLRVPAEPQPPLGTAGSLRVFRASKRWYQLQLALWSFKQVLAIGGIVFVVLLPLESIPFGVPEPMVAAALRLGIEPTGEPDQPGGPATIDWGDIERPLLAFEVLGIVLLVFQAAVSYALLRLDWELRWYMTTDRSLRIREGTWQIREKTLTLANVQNVTVDSNPIQRLLGIANVNVRTAGGGSGSGRTQHGGHTQKSDQLHEAVLRHVEDAPAIRDLILARLKAIKGAGLGDPDDHRAAPVDAMRDRRPSPDAARRSPAVLVAAQAVLHEARALRSRVS